MTARGRRVLYVSFASYVGGAEEYIARLAEALPPGWSATVAVSDPRVRTWCATRLRGLAIDVVEARQPRLRAPWTWRAFNRTLRAAAPDLVHLNAPSTYDAGVEAAALLAHRSGARVVRTDHIASLPPSRRRTALTRFSMRWVDRVLTVCESNRSALAVRGVPARKIVVVPNGTFLPAPTDSARREAVRRREGIPAGAVWALCVGALSVRKDARVVVEAVARARARGAALVLTLVGEGELAHDLRALATGHGMGDAVTLAGQRDDVGELLAAADLFVFSSRREGMPFAVLEAMAAGRAVIATAVDGIPEALDGGRCGVLVAPGDVEAMTRALTEVAGDASRRAELGEAARARVAGHFTIALMVTATVALYDDLCVAGKD